MTRPRPTFTQRVITALASMIPGTVGGKVSNASPLAYGESTVEALSIGSTATTVAATTEAQWYLDRFSLAADGAQTLDLTHAPVDESWNVYLNGVEQDEANDYTVDVDAATISLETAMKPLTGDVVDVRYSYTDKIPNDTETG
ncbi:MAG TPA: hypothetical protein VG899_12455 [Mycobacteriales bacterium]|nr:hypothetical protein [Mycobacteriales bacterium]